MPRRARHEPARGRTCRALRLALRFGGECGDDRSLPDVRCTAAESPRHVLLGACKQLAFRVRRQRSAAPNVTLVRQQLKRQRLLAAHAIYECPSCGERALGEQRCRRASCSAERWVCVTGENER